MLRFWFSPKHGWRLRSYDQRYPGCTRQQIHKVYTADAEELPSMLRNPNNLHWLPDPQEPNKQALYVGQLGLLGGMPSRYTVKKSTKNLKKIVKAASKQGKMGDLQRFLRKAGPGEDFSEVYEQVFGPGSSEKKDLAIFNLTVGEVQNLRGYQEAVFPQAPSLSVAPPSLLEGVPSVSKYVMGQASQDLKAIAEKAAQCNKAADLRNSLDKAKASDDFDQVCQSVFGPGFSENLKIFDLTVDEVRKLPNCSEILRAADQSSALPIHDDEDDMLKKGAMQTPGLDDSSVITHLKQCYVRDNKLPPLWGDESQFLESHYVPLVMMCQTEGVKQTQYQARRQPQEIFECKEPDDDDLEYGQTQTSTPGWERDFDYKLLYEVEKPVNLEKIWGKQPRHCCVLGQVGSGKTALTHYITYQWAKGKLWCDRFAWILRLPLHWVNGLKVKESIPELMARHWRCHVKDLKGLLKQPKGLIILDGWDEVVELLQGQESHPLQRFLDAHSRQAGISWLTTSRPYASLANHVKVDSHYDLIGFQQKDIAQYVEKYFGQDSEQSYDLLRYLRDIPDLCLLSQVPLYIRCLCLFKRNDKALFAQGKSWSMSYLYHNLVRRFLRYRLVKCDGEAKIKDLKDRSLDNDFTRIYAYLGKLAFDSLNEQQKLISSNLQHEAESSIEKVMQEPKAKPVNYPHEALAIGLLQTLSQGEASVHFANLSFQAFFAAYYITQSLYRPAHVQTHKEVRKVLQEYKYEMRYRQVLPLTAGLLYRKYADDEDHEAYGLRLFWSYVLSDPKDLIGIYQAVLNIRCMEACRADVDSVLEELHKPILADITSWVLAAWNVRPRLDNLGKPLTTTLPLLNLLEDVWRTCPCVLSYQLLVGDVLSKLHQWKKSAQVPPRVMLSTLATLDRLSGPAWPQVVKEVVLDYVLLACKHHDGYVRQAATKGLAATLKIGVVKQTWRAALEALARLCKDRDQSVRYAAVEELSKALESQHKEDLWIGILGTLVDVCKQANWSLREMVVQGLVHSLDRKTSEEAWIAVLKMLTSLSGDANWEVRQAVVQGLAWALLGSGEWEARVGALVDFCKDKRWSVRQIAIAGLSEALKGGCPDLAWKAIVRVMVGFSRDRNESVRQTIAQGLSIALEGKPEEASKGILDVLMHLCKDDAEKVRRAAVGGLVTILQEPCSEGIRQATVAALTRLAKDEVKSIRRAAAKGLSRALEQDPEGAEGIVKCLNELREDMDPFVRKVAVKGLSAGLDSKPEEPWSIQVAMLKNHAKHSISEVSVACEILSKNLEGNCSKEVGRDIIGVLKPLSKVKNSDICCAAIASLSKALERPCYKRECEAIIQDLKGLCKEASWIVRCAAVKGLSQAFKVQSEKQLQAITEILISLSQDKHKCVREAVAVGLAQALACKCSDQVWNKIVATLTPFSMDRDSDMRYAGVVGLSAALQPRRSDGAWIAIVENLIDICKDQDKHIRKAATVGLSKALEEQSSGIIWTPILKALTGLHGDQDPDIRHTALAGLSKALVSHCSSEQWEAILKVCKCLRKDRYAHIRLLADRVLAQLMDKPEKLLVKVLIRKAAPISLLVESSQTLQSSSYDLGAWLLSFFPGYSSESLEERVKKQQLSELVKTMTTYGPCLVRAQGNQEKAFSLVRQYFVRERQNRGWPAVG